MTEKLKPWDVLDYLQTPEECALFVQAALEESADDPAILAQALREVARARGMAQTARDAGVTREGLYKALAPEGNPSFALIVKVLGALGLRVSVEPARP